MTEHGWIATELGTATLGDRRRTRRLVQLAGAFAARPTGSIPTACGSAAATKAAYRFLDEDAVEADAILAAHVTATVRRADAEPLVLALQDTTQLELSAHPALEGAGPLAGAGQRGLLVHSVLAATDDGVPLGLLHQHRWARDPEDAGSRTTRRQRPTAEKESQRWLDALSATHAALPPETAVLTVADREADLYDLFALPRPAGSELLIRATHNRRVEHDARYLHDAIERAPVNGELVVSIGRRDARPPRPATLTLRTAALSLWPPHRRAGAAIPVVAVLAEELAPPPETPPIRWLLLTTLADASPAGARAAVRRYALRWLIERYHYALKQGCAVEALQLRQVERLERALAIYAVVAWRLLWLTYAARRDSDQPCTVALSEPEWRTLYGMIHRTAPPAEPPSLRQAVRWIAQLGGFLGRRGDGEPGVKVIWRGMQRLEDLTLGWSLAQALTAPPRDVGNA
jgi:hypothetical protein